MYLFVNAFLRKRQPNSKYLNVDIRNMFLVDILKNYVDGYIEIESTFLNNRLFVPIQELRLLDLPYGVFTFNTWLAMVSSIGLPSLPEKPVYKNNVVTFMDGRQAGFQSKRIRPVTNESGPQHPRSTLTDVQLNLDGNLSQVMYENLLVTFNGFMHCTRVTRQGLVVMGAGKSIDVSNRDIFGALNFEKVGKVTPVKLTPSMILGEVMASEIYIKLGVSLVNRSAFLSIGGFVHIQDETYSIINPEQGIIRINTPKLNVLEKLRLSAGFIDLSSLDLTENPYDPKFFVQEEVMNNQVLTQYLLLPQSFVVVVDTPHLYASREPVGQTPVHGLFEYHKEPVLPLIDSYGLLPEYWKGRGAYTLPNEPECWSLQSVVNHYVELRLDDTTGDDTDPSFTGANAVAYLKPIYNFLEIGNQIAE